MKPIGSICVAGYYFTLYNQSTFALVFETGFEDFLSHEAPDDARKVYFNEGFISLETIKTCYQAKNKQQLLWEIVDTEKGRWFFVYHPQSGQLQQQAHYDRASTTWTIHSQALAYGQSQVLNPLAYPMAPLMWYVLTTEEPMLLIHASGLTDGNTGRIFAGFSGVGKSTMASIWQSNGAEVINDDRLLIKKEKDGSWRMYNTPMYYQAHPKSAALQHIYFPFHSPSNTIENLTGAKAIAQLLAFTIHHGYDAQHLLHHSHITEQLLQSISAAKLGVVPTDAIIDFIKSHE
jgi:hypothetical protein